MLSNVGRDLGSSGATWYFCRMCVRNRKSSALASASPRHTLRPVERSNILDLYHGGMTKEKCAIHGI